MRFVILGDDRGGPAFASFTKQVEKANAAVDRNNAALKRQGAAAKDARGGIAALAGEVTGFGAAADAATSGGNKFKLALAGINLASGVLEPALAGVVVAAGGLASRARRGRGRDRRVRGRRQDGVRRGVQGRHRVRRRAGQVRRGQHLRAARRRAESRAGRVRRACPRPSRPSPSSSATPRRCGRRSPTPPRPASSGSSAGGLGLLPKILASMKPFLAPVETALRGIIGQLNTGLSSAGFKSFITLLAQNTGPGDHEDRRRDRQRHRRDRRDPAGVHARVSQSMLSGIDKITAKFREWGTTLSSGTGFKSADGHVPDRDAAGRDDPDRTSAR